MSIYNMVTNNNKYIFVVIYWYFCDTPTPT